MSYLKWMLSGTLLSLIIFFTTFFNIEETALNIYGYIKDMWLVSMSAYYSTVLIVWFINFIDTAYWSILTFFFYVVICILLFLP